MTSRRVSVMVPLLHLHTRLRAAVGREQEQAGRLAVGENIAGLALAFAKIQRQADQLVGALDVMSVGDARNSQFDLAEIVDQNERPAGTGLGFVRAGLLVLGVTQRRM